MRSNDYITFLTKEIIKKINQSEIDKQQRKKEREEKKNEHPDLLQEWFGVVPLGLGLLLKRNRNKDDEKIG
ncbi:MAG: YqzE family protein [Bacilli bacterium]